MTIVKFEVDRHWRTTGGTAIKRVEAISETAHFVTAYCDFYKRNLRYAKQGVYFDTFNEAKSYLVDQVKREIVGHQSSLDSAKAKLKKLNDMVQKETV